MIAFNMLLGRLDFDSPPKAPMLPVFLHFYD